MSDLSRITILNIHENYCDVKIEQYIREYDIVMNEQVQNNEEIKKATVYAFLLDIAIYLATYKHKEIELAFYESDDKVRKIYSSSFYDIEEANKIIEKVEILVWTVEPPDFTDSYIKNDFDEELERKRYSLEQVMYLYSTAYFIARVYFKDSKWLKGFEIGMDESSTLDTWICEWL